MTPIEAMEHVATDFIAPEHLCDRILLRQSSCALSATLRIYCKCLFQLVRDAEIIHDKTARLIFEYAIDSRNRLHQSMRPHVLVEIHRVKAGNIKACEPHVADDDQSQCIFLVLEAFSEPFSPPLVANVLLP